MVLFSWENGRNVTVSISFGMASPDSGCTTLEPPDPGYEVGTF
jgi:hypothetical protein